MSQDSNFSDPNIAQTPSGEPPLDATPRPGPTESTPAASVDSEEGSMSSVATPPSPADTLSTATPDSTDASPHETALAPAPLPPAHVPQAQHQHQQQPVQVQARNPLLYALVDFLITGLGLMVQGRVGLGITFLGINIVAILLWLIPFLGWILFFLVLLPVWITSMAMAFSTAKKWNRQHGIIS